MMINFRIGKTGRMGGVVWIEFTIRGWGFMIAF